MRCLLKLVAPMLALAVGTVAMAQGPKYGRGKTPTADEIQAADISIGPAGKELPPGSGTAKQGADIYAEKCVPCHGLNGEGNKVLGAPRLLGGNGANVGNYWPFATTIYDWINRAMPYDKPGSLTPSEVYSVTAFLLYRSNIIQESTVVDAKSLPKIEMPNRNGFIPLPWPVYPYAKPRPFGLYP